MQRRVEHTFDAPVDNVWGMVSDVAAQVSMYESMGYADVEVVDQSLDGDTFRLVTTRQMEIELPGFARHILHPSNTVESTDVWRRTADGGATGVLEMEVRGAPVTISGKVVIAPDRGATRYTVSIDIDVAVPVVGKQIAKWAMRDLDRQLDLQFEVAEDWLTEHRP